MFDLKDYKPEAPEKGTDFEPFKYKGAVRVNYARLAKSEKASEYNKTEAGANLFEMEVEVTDGDYAKRKLWKRANLDTQIADKKGKLPVQRLADQLFAVGLQFSSIEELGNCCNELVEMTPEISAYYFKGDDGKNVQVWNLKSASADTKEGTSVDF